MNRTEACVALNLIPNLGPVRLRKLLEVFSEPERVLSARLGQLESVPSIGRETATTIATWQTSVDLASELQKVAEFGAKVVTPWTPEYPRGLRELHNPPIVLYIWGDLLERDNQAVAVVGSRKSSYYGTECAKKLSYQLAFAGLTVVSGLARGIDTAAHQGALAAKGRTVAVLGSGLRSLYPAENLALAEKIASQGAVVSEYPMDTPPSVPNFPYRNRIVAGWGSGILVVEAGLKSGALITAGQAIENGRLVYAVPGPIDRASSAGSNRLIQQGAKLVTSANDLLDDLNLLFPPAAPRVPRDLSPSSQHSPPPSPPCQNARIALSPEESTVLSALADSVCGLDELSEKSGFAVHTLSALLLQMEMRRLVEVVPGGRFRMFSSGSSPSKNLL
jgi:DNA processing protein